MSQSGAVMAGVVLKHVRKVYPNGVVAIHDLDLHVADGELLVLVGPSGCGKTTTLRMIAGLERPTRGSISIGSKPLDGVPPHRRDVAMVFQHHALYPHLTAYENMAFALRLRGSAKPELDRDVRRAAALLAVEHLLDRKPKELSGGQRQRVALGRAIVRRPACFLFDEPLSDLDARLRLQMRAELKHLHRHLQTTTLYVTHDQEEALSLGDRVAVIRQGRIQQIGAPQEVYRHPANRFVAGFLGAAPMNFLTGRLTEHDGRLWFEQGSQRLPVPDWAAADLAGRVGAKVVLGIRPEVLHIQPNEVARPGELTAKIVDVESLGDRIDVHLSIDGCPSIVARLDARRHPTPGTTERIYVDLDRVHFFEWDEEADGQAFDRSGANLCLAAEKRQ